MPICERVVCQESRRGHTDRREFGARRKNTKRNTSPRAHRPAERGEPWTRAGRPHARCPRGAPTPWRAVATPGGTLSSLLNGIDGSCISRDRIRQLGSLVEHLMREVLRGHQVTQKPPRPIRGALCALSLASTQKESESTVVNHEQSEAIKGNQWALV